MMQKQRRAVSCKDAIRHKQGVLSGATDLEALERAQTYRQGRAYPRQRPSDHKQHGR